MVAVPRVFWGSFVQKKTSNDAFHKVASALSFPTRKSAKFLLSLAVFFGVAGQAQALSCQDVNSDWSSGVTVANGSTSIYTEYEFNAGDKLSWTVTFTGTGSENKYAAAVIDVYDYGIVLNSSNASGNDTVSSSFVLPSDSGAEVSLTGPVNTGATLILTCATASSDATLSALALDNGSLDPGFSSATTSYTVSVANSVSSIAITPTANDGNSTITVKGVAVTSGAASSSIPLNVGTNAIPVVVTPEYGSSKTYTVTVTREAGPVISSISPESGSTNGGTSVSITGTNLASINSVKFGTEAATNFTVNSATSISATTPAHVAGAVDVVLSDGTNTATLSSGFTYNAATFTFSPPRGALTAGTVGTAYNVTIAASGGTASYTYEVTSGELPAGLDLNSSTGVISGTPTAAESATFTITAKDANAATSPAVYTLVIGVQAPVANAVSETVAANSSANAITLNITGGAAASVAVDTQASHGTATASGTIITYTPTAGYSGVDSFTYTATNATGTSSPATVSITVSPPTSFTFSPPRGALTAGTVGTAYNVTIAASGGTASYTYEVTSGELPAGLDLNTSTGVISGTPIAAENASFTITAKDANTAQDSAAYTLSVIAAIEDLVLSPSEGNLTDAMAGETYNQQVTVSGGTAPFAFNVISGTLPDGLTLSTSGLLSGTLADNTQNDYVFEVEVRDAQNMIGKARYNLTVKEQSVQVVSQTITVEAGSSPPDTRLDKNATGGPFDSGELVSVVPSNAGRAVLTMGDYAQSGPVSPVGWYLKFTPTPGFSGPVVITFSLTSGLGSSTGTVTYNLGYNPAEVATEIDGLVRDFVRSRQSMISSTINVPGLLERRNAENANEPVTTRVSPSSNGMTIGFSTSFAQIEAYRNGAGDASGQSLGGISSSPFNVWLSGAFLMHNRDDDDDRRWGSFGMLSAGADYLITDNALVGLSFHLDRMTDPTDADAKLTGNGWLVGPYSSLEIGKGVYWDTSILYGGSANDIDTAFWDGTFDTKRWMADTTIKGQWRLDEVTVLTPKLRAVYLSEQVDDYTVSNAAGDELTLDGFTSEQLRVSLGAEVARKFTLSNDTTLTPKIGLTGGFAGLDGSGAFGTVSTGISLATPDDWTLDFSLLFNVEGDGDRYGGARARMSKRF